MPIQTKDPRSQWLLWTGLPNETFLNDGNVMAAKIFCFAGYGFVGILTLVASGLLAYHQRRTRHTIKTMNFLLKKVKSLSVDQEGKDV